MGLDSVGPPEAVVGDPDDDSEMQLARGWSRPLEHRLGRLGLLDGAPLRPSDPDAPTVLTTDSVLAPVSEWIDYRYAKGDINTAGLVSAVDLLRTRPDEAAALLASRSIRYDEALCFSAFDCARRLFNEGREHDADLRPDTSVNFMVEAQGEFLFALSTGLLDDAAAKECLGKYAVAVAFTSRWIRMPPTTLETALKFHERSIEQGNTDLRAYAYLIELLVELYNVSGAVSYLDRACEEACSAGLELMEAEVRLKRGLDLMASHQEDAVAELQLASHLAQRARPLNGVDYVRQALIHEMSLRGLLRQMPLPPRRIRLPYGFLADLPTIPAPERDDILELVKDALLPMRKQLRDRGSPPNLVAQQLLYGVLREACTRPVDARPTLARALVALAEETCQYAEDRYAQWRYLEARLIRARLDRDIDATERLVRAAEEFVAAHDEWPLGYVTLAEVLQLRGEIEGAEWRQRAAAAWEDATHRVTSSPDLRRTDLGGRNSGVFAIEDARGDLSTALVFKPVEFIEDARRERQTIERLDALISEAGMSAQFAVPRSLSIVPIEEHIRPADLPREVGAVHVMERQLGTLLADLPKEEVRVHLQACVELLVLFQGSSRPSQSATGWRPVRDRLKAYSRALFDTDAEARAFVAAFREALPALPAVTKRDSHLSNWVLDPSGRIIAIDLEAAVPVPMIHDLAQLIEDGAALDVSPEGIAERLSLLEAYCQGLGFDDEASAVKAYECFSIYRAIWLATAAHASKSEHRHARLLARHFAGHSSHADVRALAALASGAMRQLPDRQQRTAPLTARQRKLSKKLARLLRHAALEAGLDVDEGGFVSLQEAASYLQRPEADLVEVAAHPLEPRFQVDEGRIRALYGHSFPIDDAPELDVELPDTLFHGSTWSSLDAIADEGLRSMKRREVYLTNNPLEALEVARRHGRPVLLEVHTTGEETPRAAADAIWAVSSVAPASLSVVNPFTAIASPPTWLRELAEDQPSFAK